MNLPEFLTQAPDGYIHLTGHRIGLHHVVRLYKAGYTPEMLAAQYPTLALALIHKVIAFYLENPTEVGAYVAREDEAYERQAAAPQRTPSAAELRRRMEALRQAEAE
jgi:uncharacterized protein (DUF433 family)